MDFGFGDDVDAFRHQVRQELSAQMDAVRTEGVADPTDLTGLPEATERRLLKWAGAKGWLALSLPTRYGGCGLAPRWQAAFNLEAARSDAPLIDTAVTLAAQPLLDFGTEDQKEQLLPLIAKGALIFCIAYSEEDAGSDLANLTTRAVTTDNAGFTLTGTKAHVTGAHKSDWCLTVARTDQDRPARRGLSMFLVPMNSPGISVTRRPTMNGWTLCEVGFDNVSLGPGALLGQLHNGWGQLLAAVGTEGGGMFHVGFAQRALEALAQEVPDPQLYGRFQIELAAAERLAIRAADAASPTRSAMAKVYATELLQRMATAGSAVARRGTEVRPARSGAESTGRLGWEYIERVHGTIGGGTNEMKRSLIVRQPPDTHDVDADMDALTGDAATAMALAAMTVGQTQRLVLAAALCRVTGSEELLKRVRAGDPIAACLGDHSSITPAAMPTFQARPTGKLWELDGEANLVPGADGATHLLVVAGTPNGPMVAVIDAGVARRQPVPTLGDDGRADVVLRSGGEIVGRPSAAELARVIDWTRLAVAAEMAGAASAALRSAVERARTREQFGRPIIEFQALAHRLADGVIDLQTVTDAVADGAGAYDRGDPRAHLLIAGAKALANEACPRITATAHQVWGAEGIYADRPLHRWHGRVQALSADLGRSTDLLRHVGAAALAQTGNVSPNTS